VGAAAVVAEQGKGSVDVSVHGNLHEMAYPRSAQGIRDHLGMLSCISGDGRIYFFAIPGDPVDGHEQPVFCESSS
jgi:hypothetical protein